MMKWSVQQKQYRKRGSKQAYIREGCALQQLGQHADALAAFALGLAQDAGNSSLLAGLMDSALKSPLKEKLEPILQQLQKLKLEKSPFVIISVIGQELLQVGHYNASVQMLESSVKIGTCSLKLRGSVFSALSSAHWGLGNIDKAITFMQKDLQVSKELGDQEGECRAYGNLGAAHYSKGNYKEALTNHRFQLVLSMRLKDRQTATVALSSLGHVYTAIGDYPNALQSHKQCVVLLKQSGDKTIEAREIGNVGAVYLAMCNFDKAVECHNENLKIAKALKNSIEEARAYSNLGSAYHYKRDYEKAIVFHKQVLKIAEQRADKSLEARAYAGLGHAARCLHDYAVAKNYHEKQLDSALQARDKVAEGRACSNLGIIYHQLGEFEAALKLHKVHLSIAKDLCDQASHGRSLGNIGNAYSALGKYEQAVKYHKQELEISQEVNDRHSEAATHGNLAVAYQALKMYDSAHHHYVEHLELSRELKDTMSESRAVCNLGNFHSFRGEYTNSIPYYEQYLMLTQELHDTEGEAKACFNLGYAHFALGNYMEAVRYYEQDLSLARELKDNLGVARAYCNLGLAQKALHNYSEGLECQKKALHLMTTLKNTKGKFRCLGNIGDILLKTGDTTEAIQFYNQQLQLARQCNSKDLSATAYGALGTAHRVLLQFDKALGFHTQELSIRQDMADVKGECRAHGNLGNVHMSLGKYMNAYTCYQEQLEKSRELQDSALEANACGNLAITKMNMTNFEEAIGLFEQQLAMLEQVHGNSALFDKGRAFGNLGDCYEALGDYEEAIKCHEQYLAIAQKVSNKSDQDKAYRGLGNAHRSVGNLQQALVCFEKRLVVAHELNSSVAKASAYGELGCLHSLLGNFEQAISCLQHQLNIAQEMKDRLCEGDAACGLGGVYQQMGEYEKALEYHQMDQQIAEASENMACQCRAFGNLGLSHESLGNYEEAIEYQEQHLSIAAQMNDRVAKTLAYSSLGRIHHAMGNHPQAVEYLRQGLQIAVQLGRMEDEAKIRHRLGLSLWGKGDFEECQQQLSKASELFESIRRDAQFNSEYKLSLFDLQTACYQALQRVLVTLEHHEEALVVAERACTRAFIDLLMERQAGVEGFYGNQDTHPFPITASQILETVSKQKGPVLCFSVAAGFLYSWLLMPKDGIVKFHEVSMAELESEGDTGDAISLKSVSFSTNLLDNFVGHVRESMGVETHAPSGGRGLLKSVSFDTDSEAGDIWEQHLEELGDKLNAENDRTGFLRIVNRNHLFNSSNYSLSSLFSVSANLNGLTSHSTTGLARKNSISSKLGNKSPVSAVYELLIEPFEDVLKELYEEQNPIDLALVLQGDMYLIPFNILRKDQTMDYLFERFNIRMVPSITALLDGQKTEKHSRPVITSTGAIIVGNPKLTPYIIQHWHLHDISSAEYEARIVGELLTARPLIGTEATKGAVLNQIEQVEVIHFACHVSWKLSSVVLAPGELTSPPHKFPSIDSDDSSSDISSFDGPSLSEYLLTAADILNLKLHAKLVVLSSGYTDDRAGRINSDGVVGLTRSFLSAGAKCVMYCLWPVPDGASKLLMRTLYTSLQEGKLISQALSMAIKTVQSTKQFSHPSNWGGWILVGQDIRLSSKVAQMGHALCEILQSTLQCREAMRVLLHLIEKSLQRIHQGIKNSMYTTYVSIDNKVGVVSGWKDLLQAVGFRFELATSNLPSAVFFPLTDPGGRLTQASTSLKALLGLPPGALSALVKFLPNTEAGEAVIHLMREILSRMAAKETSVAIQVNVNLWRTPGCHEFFASLGLDLVEVGNDDVTLRLGKQANRRQLQFALQSLVAVFDMMEAPRILSQDSSSSLESLSSSHSGSCSTSTSNLSRGSTPQMSPRGRKKSLFNPAEMEKIRSSNRLNLMTQGGLTARKVVSAQSGQAGGSDPSVYLDYQNKIKSMYPSVSEGESCEVTVMSLSDSDTQKSVSDGFDLGNSNTSDKFLSQHKSNLESTPGTIFESGQSSEKFNVSWSSDIPSLKSSLSSEEFVFSRQGSDVLDSSSSSVFKRNTNTRTSNVSDESGTSVEVFERSDSKRGSDTSDLSTGCAGGLTPKNQQDLVMFLKQTSEDPGIHQLSSESGIVSETTSSNQSDASHQSDSNQFHFDPQEIASKIMSEVTDQKAALDSMQQISALKLSQDSYLLRKQLFEQDAKTDNVDPYTERETNLTSVDSSQICTKGINPSQHSQKSVPQIHSFTSTFTEIHSSPSMLSYMGVKVPPPVPTKPQSYQSQFSTFHPQPQQPKLAHHSKQRLSSSRSISASSLTVTPQAASSVEPVPIPKGPLGVIQGNACMSSQVELSSFNNALRKESVSSTTSFSSSSLSSFRPAKQMGFADQSAAQFLKAQNRPDSSTSTSSYCSTPSSIKTVIYNPSSSQPQPHANTSPSVMSYDSSSDQNSGSNSCSQSSNSFYSVNTSLQQGLREASPALSSSSSASGKGSKPKKKVSFSDSEPSESPTPSSSNNFQYSSTTNGNKSQIYLADHNSRGSAFGSVSLGQPRTKEYPGAPNNMLKGYSNSTKSNLPSRTSNFLGNSSNIQHSARVDESRTEPEVKPYSGKSVNSLVRSSAMTRLHNLTHGDKELSQGYTRTLLESQQKNRVQSQGIHNPAFDYGEKASSIPNGSENEQMRVNNGGVPNMTANQNIYQLRELFKSDKREYAKDCVVLQSSKC
ncbi:hypothetical protein CHS0354_003712 [Potamilus streckersoni]|uniref:Tetratricopeptide repeat protein 28 n=1 Tax=Potamilus streckersoni TaxID=2493646 RepID=A0AAE0W084_9BIVA|nr:hypothetical protein CHS0354_003712 [Potamilus streckersoni]